MNNTDTTKLLRECDAGSKMAVNGIDEVIDKAENNELKELLIESKDHHSKLGNDLHSLLKEYGSDDKEPNMMAKSMAKMKSGLKMEMDKSDETIADLITDGCNMGIKSLNRYLNQYVAANEESKKICNKLIDIEEELRMKICKFL